MAEAAYMQSLCHDIAFPARLRGEGRKGQINHVHHEVSKRGAVSWRRVKAFFYGEVPDGAVRLREVRQFEDTAAELEAARKAHADFIAETQRMAAFRFAPDADFYSDQIEARGRVAFGMDRPRIAGGDE